ncbi:BgTH12-02889 [Blumeria graminis f. sp. triticale]|uniref:Vacuolar import and degradation protein 21 n=3 Tax=Blumeria graminis TaxID=34373 RepID=A0A9W4D338_BLUGR|nr:BgTH12-02889 [Blumeria graminis f. sp. triticale]
MSEVGAADRSRLLRLKKAELSGIVKSRKRKLRELFAVCDNESPIPQLDFSNPDAPPINSAEAHFLAVTDILQNRLFDESNLPLRCQKKTNASRTKSSAHKTSSELRKSEIQRKAGKPHRDESNIKKGRTNLFEVASEGDKSLATIKTQSKEAFVQKDIVPKKLYKSSHTESPAQAVSSIKEPRNRNDSQRPSNSPPLNHDLLHRFDFKKQEREVDDTSIPTPSPRHALHNSKHAFRSHNTLRGSEKNVPTEFSDEEVLEIRSGFRGKTQSQKEIQNENLSTEMLSQETCLDKVSIGTKLDAHSAATPDLVDRSTDTSLEMKIRKAVNKLDTGNSAATLSPEPEYLHQNFKHVHQDNMVCKPQGNIVHQSLTKGECRPSERKLIEEQVTKTVVEENTLPESLSDEASDTVLEVIENVEHNEGGSPDRDEISPASSVPLNVPDSATEGVRETVDASAGDQMYDRCATDIDSVKVLDSCESTTSSEALKTGLIFPLGSAVESDTSVPLFNCLKIPYVSSAASVKYTSAPPTPECRNTRISSGVLERKSVSEIIEGSKSSSGLILKSAIKPSLGFTKASHSTTQVTSRVQLLAQKRKEKGRSKLSNVIFSHKPSKVAPELNPVQGMDKLSESLKDDYFLPLFLANASAGKGIIPALDTLMATAHKTITTSNALVPIKENQTAKILKRIYHLQSSHKWSLRQPKRSIEPVRPVSHWDILLQEASWMRTDFKEERKWKKVIARNMALACAEWVLSSREERKQLQVEISSQSPGKSDDVTTIDTANQINAYATPDISMSGECESPTHDFDEEPRINLLETISPTEIFSLQDEDVIFGLRSSPTADKLLDELPMYGVPLQVPLVDTQAPENDPDRFWKRPALPLSKFVEGRIRLKQEAPPKKRSRFEYQEEDIEEGEDKRITFGEDQTKHELLPPESTDVALFNPKNRHILERIRNVNCFRPPSEFHMPLQTFYECRTASQWTWDEDKELKLLVRDFTYNWSLISSILSSKSKSNLTTGAERRTPWECFERWIELEGLPGDMQKTHYFKLYTSRIENANKIIMASQPTHNAQGQIQQVRKRSTASVRVERRRNQKHLILIDTMRKLAKKRETILQKQQHAASMAAIRKSQEAPHVTSRSLSVTTPQDFSRLKYEREEVIKERFLHLQQRQEAQRRAAISQRNSGTHPPQPGLPCIIRPPAGATAILNSSNSVNHASNIPGQNRLHQIPSQISTPNSSALRMNMNSVPQAPMQGQIPLSNSSLDVGLVSRAHAISQHQQAILRQQQQQQGQVTGQSSQVHNSPSRINGLSAPGFSMRGNMVPPFPSNPNGVSTSPTTSLTSPSQVGSSQTTQAPQALSHVQRMEIQYKAKYPSATADQITSMISQALAQSIQQQRQNTGQGSVNNVSNVPIPLVNGIATSQKSTPQLYAQMLRQQQEAQQKQQTSATGSNLQLNHQGGIGRGKPGPGHLHKPSIESSPTAN